MAKLRPEQINAATAKQLAPIYLVTGDEALLIQETCDTIRYAARKAGFTERDLFHCDTQFDWGQVQASAQSLSLFADKKIIELRLINAKLNDKASSLLQDYATSFSTDNLLLLIAENSDKAIQKTKWFTALETVGCHIHHWPVTTENLPQWIAQRLKHAGLQADTAAIDLLAARVEGNLLAAVQEIEKLKLIAPNHLVTAELMASAVADSARYDVFGLTDKALYGDARGAAKTLQGLKAEGTDAITVLWSLTREIRQLAQIADACAQGKSFELAAKQIGVWDKKQPLFRATLQRLKLPQIQHLLRKANGIDKAIKGMRNAEPWDELLDLVLQLSGVQSLTTANERLTLKL